MRMLLHACCGPCSLEPTRLLLSAGHTFDIFFANSNIAPRAEYEHRLSVLRAYAATIGVDVRGGSYDPAQWEARVAPVGESLLAQRDAEAKRAQALGHEPASVAELLDDEHRRERCRLCYRLRLEEAARAAAEGPYDALATTLAVSPYQFTDVIREELERAGKQAGVPVYFEDWRPYYDDATRRSRELGMYRQAYCGCRFSVAEAEATRTFIREQQHARKERERAAHTAERAQQERERARKAAEKRAYAAKQQRKRAVLKELRRAARAEQQKNPKA